MNGCLLQPFLQPKYHKHILANVTTNTTDISIDAIRCGHFSELHDMNNTKWKNAITSSTVLGGKEKING